MHEIERDEFGVVRHHVEDAILELEWLEASAGMTDDDFMASMQRFADRAEEYRTPFLLVDVTRFRHSPGDGVGAWRDKHVIPRYNGAGVRKFAFLVPAGSPGTVESGHPPTEEAPGEFPTGCFDVRQDILDWFEGPGA
ncbi:MAG: hypothetical protein ACRDJO_03060 [Actinomycetota bacterium]